MLPRSLMAAAALLLCRPPGTVRLRAAGVVAPSGVAGSRGEPVARLSVFPV